MITFTSRLIPAFAAVAVVTALALTDTAPRAFAETAVTVGGAAMYPSKNIIENAVNSKDHTTLVAAVKAAGLVETLSGKGPFMVFAPTNAAFDKLPAGTVEGLLRPESKDALRNILEYHVSVGVYKLDNLQDGQKINQVNLDDVVIGFKDGKYTVNGANILGTAPASNGIVYIIDAVLLPPAAKN